MQCTSNKERREIAIKDKRELRSSEAGKIKIRIIKASMDEHWAEDNCGLRQYQTDFRGSEVCVVNQKLPVDMTEHCADRYGNDTANERDIQTKMQLLSQFAGVCHMLLFTAMITAWKIEH
jgi:hypothetical protein